MCNVWRERERKRQTDTKRKKTGEIHVAQPQKSVYVQQCQQGAPLDSATINSLASKGHTTEQQPIRWLMHLQMEMEKA